VNKPDIIDYFGFVLQKTTTIGCRFVKRAYRAFSARKGGSFIPIRRQ
jgi:hypothetical protein